MTDPAHPPPGPPSGAPDWAALARLAAGEAAAADPERAHDDAARAWLAAHEGERARLDALDRLVGDALRGDPALTTQLRAGAPAVDVEAALARVRRQAGLDRAEPATEVAAVEAGAPRLTVVRGGAPRETTPARRVGTASARRSAPAWRRAGALLAASVAVAAGVKLWRGQTPATGGEALAAAQRYTTGVGERRVLHLADGSQVVLGPASTLEVPDGFAARSGESRRVRLVGEAYFRAAHDARRPFEVAAGDALVRDIGTAFVVRAPTLAARQATGPASTGTVSAGTVDVAVTEGAVQLRTADRRQTAATSPSAVLLRAGDRGRVQAAAGSAAPTVAIVARGTDVAADTAWTTGRLVFRDAPLTAVAGELRRWYGLELQFADSAVANRHLTATFAGESAGAVLRVVGLATGAHLDRRGDTVVVREAAPSP